MPGIKAARGDLILAGALVIDGVLEAGGFDGFEATEAGLREGVFFERCSTPDRRWSSDVRRDAVRNLAAQYDTDFAHTEHVARLALEIWDALARGRRCTRATPTSASSSGRPRCCTTSASPSTTTTTTSTRAT